MVWQIYFDDWYIKRKIPALSWTLHMLVKQHICAFLNIASPTKSIGDIPNVKIFYKQ